MANNNFLDKLKDNMEMRVFLHHKKIVITEI